MQELCSTRHRCEGKVTQLLQGIFYPVVRGFIGAVTTSTIYTIQTQPFNPNNVILWNTNRRASSVLGVKWSKCEVHSTHSGWFIPLIWNVALGLGNQSAARYPWSPDKAAAQLCRDVVIILWCPCNRQGWLCNCGKLLGHSASQKGTADV